MYIDAHYEFYGYQVQIWDDRNKTGSWDNYGDPCGKVDADNLYNVLIELGYKPRIVEKRR